jgi:hypothetical protein
VYDSRSIVVVSLELILSYGVLGLYGIRVLILVGSACKESRYPLSFFEICSIRIGIVRCVL